MKIMISILSVTSLLLVTPFTTAVAADSAVFLNNFEQNDFAGVPVFGGSGDTFFAEVLGGVVGGPLFAIANVDNSEVVFTGSGLLGSGGIFDGNYGIIPTVAAGATGQFEVRVWQDTATFDTATIRGTSGLFTQVVGTAPAGGGVPSDVVALNIPGPIIQLAVVPEPSVIALGVLGGLGLLLRRRK